MILMGKYLAEYRKKRGIKRTDFAKEIGITYSAACKYESDIRKPSVEVLVKMADFLGVSTDELLGRVQRESDRKLFPHRHCFCQSVIKQRPEQQG